MPHFLCRHLDKRTEWSFEAGDAAVLGFSENATVPLPDPGLLARELRITRSGDRYHLRDLAEKDRVLVNGVITRDAVLKHGDRIVVGRIAMLFEDAERSRGEVDLFRVSEESNGDLWEVLAAEAEKLPRLRPPGGIEQSQWKRYCLELCFISLFFGMAFGFLYKVPRPPRPAGRTTAPPVGTAPGPRPGGTASETRTDDGDTLRKLEEMLKVSRAETTPAPPAEETAPHGDTAPPAAASSSPFVLDRSLEPAASRRLLFKIFLDVAGRPPTRAEERNAFPLPHRDRFRLASEASGGRDLPASPFMAWLGREPTSAEEKDLAGRATGELPAALWVTAHEEYLARVRERAPGQRAASFVVDLLDRPIASPAELDIVQAALAEPDQEAHVARVLAHSPDNRLDSTGDPSWELDFFRFFLREPLPEERSALASALEKTGEPQRRKAFLAALAAHPAYRRY